jgi:hypothetical protein
MKKMHVHLIYNGVIIILLVHLLFGDRPNRGGSIAEIAPRSIQAKLSATDVLAPYNYIEDFRHVQMWTEPPGELDEIVVRNAVDKASGKVYVITIRLFDRPRISIPPLPSSNPAIFNDMQVKYFDIQEQSDK